MSHDRNLRNPQRHQPQQRPGEGSDLGRRNPNPQLNPSNPKPGQERRDNENRRKNPERNPHGKA